MMEHETAAGCWVAYYPDYSGFTTHGSEIDALRSAVNKSQYVIFLPYGVDLRDAVQAEWDEREH